MKTSANFEIRILLWWITSPCDFSAQLQKQTSAKWNSVKIHCNFNGLHSFILASILLLHVFFQFHLKYSFTFSKWHETVNKKPENKNFYIGSNDASIQMERICFWNWNFLKNFSLFFQVILKLFLIFSPFWVGHLYRSV